MGVNSNMIIKRMLEEIDKEVYECHKCGGLVEKFPNSSTVF